MMGALDRLGGHLIVTTPRTKGIADSIALLGDIDCGCGARPGLTDKPVINTLDNRPLHVSKVNKAALAASVLAYAEWLSKNGCELDGIEFVWHALKALTLPTKSFKDAENLYVAIHKAVIELNLEQNRHPLDKVSFSA